MNVLSILSIRKKTMSQVSIMTKQMEFSRFIHRSKSYYKFLINSLLVCIKIDLSNSFLILREQQCCSIDFLFHEISTSCYNLEVSWTIPKYTMSCFTPWLFGLTLLNITYGDHCRTNRHSSYYIDLDLNTVYCCMSCENCHLHC